jgi:hypothetical protein
MKKEHFPNLPVMIEKDYKDYKNQYENIFTKKLQQSIH